MFTFLLVIHALIAAALVAVILMQRSEGGGLGVGGSPSGLMSARGAADFLTRATTILATLFVLMSIGLAALATVQRGPREIDTSLAREAPVPAAPDSPVPMAGDPAGAAGNSAAVPPVTVTPAAPAQQNAPAQQTRSAQPVPKPEPRAQQPSAPKPQAAAPKAAEKPAEPAPVLVVPPPAGNHTNSNAAVPLAQ